MNQPVKSVTQKPLTSADVQSCIQRHFGMGGEKYSVLFEVRNGTAWHANRSIDAVVMSLWPSLGMELMGMEIKISRGDWRREYKTPAKASEVFDYFDRWYLVAPDNVATDEEIPEPWGWYVPENGTLRKRRDAAKNPHVKLIDRHFLAALLRRTAKTDDAFVLSRVNDALNEQRRQLDAEIDGRALQRLGDLKKDAEQWAALRGLLKDKPDGYIYQPDVVEAIKIIMKAGITRSYGALRSLLDETARTHDRLVEIATELGVDIKPKKRERI